MFITPLKEEIEFAVRFLLSEYVGLHYYFSN